LVGSTAISAQLDPEEWHGNAARYQKEAAEAATGNQVHNLRLRICGGQCDVKMEISGLDGRFRGVVTMTGEDKARHSPEASVTA